MSRMMRMNWVSLVFSLSGLFMSIALDNKAMGLAFALTGTILCVVNVIIATKFPSWKKTKRNA